MTLESSPFRLRQCIEEAIDLFASQVRLKRLETVYLVAPEVPHHLIGDVMRLRQIFVNLIGNAIKFTAKGEIVINVECQSRDEKGAHLLFSVSDTGIGIPKEGIERLFQSFQQVDASTTRHYGGTGLGSGHQQAPGRLDGGHDVGRERAGRWLNFFLYRGVGGILPSGPGRHAARPHFAPVRARFLSWTITPRIVKFWRPN